MDGRVLICDSDFPLATARTILPGAETGRVADAGPGVVAILVSPESPVAAGDIESAPDLRLIATASVGTDHIATDAAEARGISVVNVPDYCIEEVSDHALAMVVALRRGLIAGDRSVQAGAWDPKAAGELGLLAGTRLGVVGFGRIGRRLAAGAGALRMDVRHHDPFVPGGMELDDLLRWADAVSLHTPLTDETHGLIDARRLALMRPGAILVNTARGAVVDREALKAATHIRAAFDNVWERPPGVDLLGLPHLTMTPYVAWYSTGRELEPYLRAAKAIAEALGRSIISGR
jgi:D-3-phosphoglycerate dehydrogenase / 2-oxoglutarate reductase